MGTDRTLTIFQCWVYWGLQFSFQGGFRIFLSLGEEVSHFLKNGNPPREADPPLPGRLTPLPPSKKADPLPPVERQVLVKT